MSDVDVQAIFEDEYAKFEKTVRARVAEESAKSDAQRKREKLEASMDNIGVEMLQLQNEPTKNKERLAELNKAMKEAESQVTELTPDEEKAEVPSWMGAYRG